MSDIKPLFQVRICISSPDEKKESEAVRVVASQFLRMGVNPMTVIADDEHVNYVGNEVYNVTTGDLFRTDPCSPTDVFICTNSSSTLN